LGGKYLREECWRLSKIRRSGHGDDDRNGRRRFGRLHINPEVRWPSVRELDPVQCGSHRAPDLKLRPGQMQSTLKNTLALAWVVATKDAHEHLAVSIRASCNQHGVST
jgi:hypothetical protein